MPLAYLYPLKEMDFQGKKYRIPKEIELYLERLYGNYMELPKEEKENQSMRYIGIMKMSRVRERRV